ncbi:glycoside hydrolase family 31 protein [Zasmidium cellare ATCC 36951]|uniref:Probable alpha/beta-glucosidase agdC n=1 Tax=Zasmidium cellare ATCC 36951 TaxID=1080233 RepID=A0A6A6CUQ3_ZASCE|nr:glycoside hydrolase family 31 protein [Zasmidium cellare ATCC 36951]KAF2170443.1 glycoside hydrolase family 31 protein [Zasmidium cellare ATCC 36951]
MMKAFSTLALLATAANSQQTAAQDIGNCPGYRASNVQRSSGRITADLSLAGDACNAYSDDLPNLRLLVEYQAQQRLHVKIYDADERVYQVPEAVLYRPGNATVEEADSDLYFRLVEDPFEFAVVRNATGEVLFDTTGQALVFESQYIRLRTSLPTDPNIYGLGENSDPLRLPTTGYSHPFWNVGPSFLPAGNLYGTFKAYYDHRGANGTHAVYHLNSNGERVFLDVDDQGQYLEYNANGGVFDFYFVTGATPREASAQFADVIGHSTLMPYWSFGYHHCRYGLQDVYEAAQIIANYSVAEIPLETFWIDIDHMYRKQTFSLDPDRWSLEKVREYIDYLHSHQQKSVFIIEPAIPTQLRDSIPGEPGTYTAHEDLVESKAYFQFPNGSAVPGVVWGGGSIYPDWFDPAVQDFWNGEFAKFFSAESGIDIDGLWIDMNEAANFCNPTCRNATLDGIHQQRPERIPAVRISSPYEIPGWPEDWQPMCVSYTRFNIAAQVDGDKEIITIIGNISALADGRAKDGPALNIQTENGYAIVVQLPPNTIVSYQYPRYAYAIDGSYIFEAQNRTITTGGCNDMWHPQEVNDTITTSTTNLTIVPFTPYQPTPEEGPGPDVPEGSMLGLPGRNLAYPEYNINSTVGSLSDQGLPTNVYHDGGWAEYDVHNLFGAMMSSASRDAMISRRPDKRPLVITRSSYMGSGSQIGHWFGDNNADWRSYLISIRQMASFASLFQFPMVGSDTCGHNGNVTIELCARWAMLGAFNPFFRNHKVTGAQPQEFYLWPEVATAARKAINRRLQLLDYLYTAFYRQSTSGVPTISPLFFNYPNDTATFALETQFFFGDDILVSPVTAEGATSVDAYLPDDLFYDFETFAPIRGSAANHTLENVALDEIPVLIRGGAIIPLRANPANTTTEVRKQDFRLLVAPGLDGSARGYLYLDDGEALDPGEQTTFATFSYADEDGVLRVNGTFGYQTDRIISEVVLLGMDGTPASLTAPSGNVSVLL